MNDLRSGIIFAHHGLGDLVMLLPALSLVAKSLTEPSDVIVFVKDQRSVELLELVGLTAKFNVRVLDRKLAFWAAIRLRWPRRDFLVAPLDYGGSKMRLIACLSGARRAVLASRLAFVPGTDHIEATDRFRLHKSRYYLQSFSAAGFQLQGDPDLKLPRLAAARKRAEGQLPLDWVGQRLLVLAPGSGEIEAHKRWPASGYARLIQLVLAEKLVRGCIVLGGPSEADLLDSIVKAADVGAECVPLASDSLELTFGVLSLASCLVANCNGPSHLAGLVNLPIVGLYGPTNPLFTGPASNRLRIVRRRLRCSPCYRADFLRGCGDPVCLTRVAPAEVLEAVRDALADVPIPPEPWDNNSRATQPDERLRDHRP